ncbi:hypothetical protein AMECASPLE_038923 [Ameca splendens]|uniref:Uncharacterized protein n=1 Tax=Ameca splendens TaxID=208324 RepID=A0ABV0YKK7_9TELE
MEDNPDMAGADAGTWDRHLIHHLSKIREEHKKDEEELKTLQTQLLKMQLAEAKQKAGDKKKDNKTPKIMYEGAVSQGPQPPPFPGHQDTIAPRSATSGPYHAQPGRFRGRGGPRGRGFRGGPPRRRGVLTFATTVRSRVIGSKNVHTTLRHMVVGMDPEESQGDARIKDGVVHRVKGNSSNLHFSCKPGMNPALARTTTEGPHRTPRTEGLRTPYCP